MQATYSPAFASSVNWIHTHSASSSYYRSVFISPLAPYFYSPALYRSFAYVPLWRQMANVRINWSVSWCVSASSPVFSYCRRSVFSVVFSMSTIISMNGWYNGIAIFANHSPYHVRSCVRMVWNRDPSFRFTWPNICVQCWWALRRACGCIRVKRWWVGVISSSGCRGRIHVRVLRLMFSLV